MTSVENALVDYVRDTTYGDISAAAIEAAKAQLLDSLAVGIAGREEAGVREVRALCDEWGGAGQATVLGTVSRLPAPLAAQLNATMIHALDYDDGHEAALIHPGVVVTSTGYAIGQRAGGLSGQDLLSAVALGTDLLGRLGVSLEIAGSRSTSGWHLTSIFGCLVSAAIAGRVLRLDADELSNAIGIAYHQTAGNMQSVLDGRLTKRLGPGFAVRNGITAALLARQGATGTPRWLTGRNGLIAQYFRGSLDEDRLLGQLGTSYYGPNVSIKKYPACGITHPFIDAALEIAPQIDVHDITRVRLYRGEAAEYVFEPFEQKVRPRNVVDAQFSSQWGVAAALAYGRVGPDCYSAKAIADAELLSLTDRMDVFVEPELNRGEGIEGGRVEVMLADGQVVTARSAARVSDGGPGATAMSLVRGKLDVCLDGALRARAEQLFATFAELDGLDEATSTIDLFAAIP